MIVISRARDESILIGDDIRVTIIDIRGDKVRLGIELPRGMPLHRAEVYAALHQPPAESVSAPVAPAAIATPPARETILEQTVERQQRTIDRQQELIGRIEALIREFRQS